MKFLFIGDGYPVADNAGSFLYQKILKALSIENCCYYGVGYRTRNLWPIEFQEMPRNNSCLRIWPINRLTKYLKKIPIIEEAFYFLKIPLTVKRIEKFAIKNEINIVIVSLRADVIAIINKFIEHHKYPLLVYISDPVETDYYDKPKIYNYKYNEYLKAIENANGIYVAGEAMLDLVTKRFNKKTSILRLGYPCNIKSDRETNNSREVRIFFSGSVYAKSELETFLEALSILASKYPNYTFTFAAATKYIIKFIPNNFKIVNLGWLEESALVKIMLKSQIGYVPYKFDNKDAVQMKYAFPSKAGFYLSAGLPIYFHGPEYSSMNPFLNKYPCGIHCASMDKTLIVTCLEKILFDGDFYKQCLLAGIEAYNNEFTMDVMENSIKKLLNCINS